MLRKIGKVLGIILAVLIISFIAVYAIYNEKLPEGRPGPDADALAQKMLSTLNYDAYTNTDIWNGLFKGVPITTNGTRRSAKLKFHGTIIW